MASTTTKKSRRRMKVGKGPMSNSKSMGRKKKRGNKNTEKKKVVVEIKRCRMSNRKKGRLHLKRRKALKIKGRRRRVATEIIVKLLKSKSSPLPHRL